MTHPSPPAVDTISPSTGRLETRGPTGGKNHAALWTSLVAAAAALLGISFALLMPPFQFNDEHGHFARAFQISRGQIVGRGDSRIPDSVLSVLYQYPEGVPDGAKPAGATGALLASKTAATRLKYFRWSLLATQVYWPVVYLPAAAGIAMARWLDLSPLGMLYAARVMNVLFFLAALVTALLLLPDFRALMAAVALMPTTVAQAAAVSADQMTIALSLVGFALVLRTRQQPAGRRYLLFLLIFVPLWVMCKNSYWALLLLLLIPGRRFGGKWKRAAYLSAAMLATLAVLIGWNYLAHDAYTAFRQGGLSRGIDLTANARTLVLHPLAILHDVTAHNGLLGLAAYFRHLLDQFIGGVGWNFIGPPAHFAYLAMLLAVAALEWNPRPFTATERTLLALIFAGALIGSYIVLFMVDGTYQGGHYVFSSAGVQGRYLIPYCLAGLLLLKQTEITAGSRVLLPIVLTVGTIYGIVALRVIVNFYRV